MRYQSKAECKFDNDGDYQKNSDAKLHVILRLVMKLRVASSTKFVTEINTIECIQTVGAASSLP